MSTLRALLICTGNTCRSPMGAAILRARFASAGIASEVSSAGTLGWNERPATPHAVTVMQEWGLDLGAHTSRRLEPEHLDADLIVAMTRDHAGAVIARDSEVRSCVFLPAEFARLAGGLGSGPTRGGGGDMWRTVVTRVGAQRDGTLIGRPEEEIADPAGEPLEVYRATAARLDRALTRLVAALGA